MKAEFRRVLFLWMLLVDCGLIVAALWTHDLVVLGCGMCAGAGAAAAYFRSV